MIVRKMSRCVPYSQIKPNTDIWQVQLAADWVAKRADEIQRCADKMKEQLKYKNPIWLKGLMRRNMGKDISYLLDDLEYVEKNGQTRRTTWGEGGSGQRKKENSRRAGNVMGYQFEAAGNIGNNK